MARFSGTITATSTSVTYQIRLLQGQNYIIDLRGTGGEVGLRDPVLSIIGEDGQFTEDDNGGIGRNAQLVFRPDRTQYYEFTVAGNAGTTGNFALDVNIDDFRNGRIGSAPAGEAPADGEQRLGRINYEGDVDVYAVSLVAGLTYSFRMLPGPHGTDRVDHARLTLLSASGQAIAADEDSGAWDDAFISFKARTSGDYWLWAEESDGETGTYFMRTSVGRGSPSADRLRGGDGADVLNALGGDDDVRGGAGNDRIWGASGKDTLAGEDGSDRILGGLHDDTIDGGLGHDDLFGEAGRDSLDGGDGNDTVDGGDWKDVATGGAGADYVSGGLGNDRLDGGDGNDSVYGGDGNDLATGGTGLDYVSGDLGDDRLDGGDGSDFVDGGDGNDVATGGTGADDVSGYLGDDRLDGGDGNDYLNGGEGRDRITGGFDHDSLYGESGDDLLLGDDGDDYIDGGSENDDIHGVQGNDSLYGGEGDDILNGGEDGDFYWGGEGLDVFRFTSIFHSLLADPDEIGGFDRAGGTAGDLFDLSLIDADRTTPGNDTLVFGAGQGKGSIWLENDTAKGSLSTLLYLNVDNDADAEFLLKISDGRSITANEYSTADFVL